MAGPDPDFTLGIEEEYLLVDAETMQLRDAPTALMEACAAALDTQVSPEFLRCQIEIGTRVCENVTAAREDLRRLRATVADCADRYGLRPIAVSCHPFADWKEQHHTDKERYNQLHDQLAGVARRMLICGMHVHVGVPDRDMRIDLMNQLSYFLPHLLALSANSPFWQGQDSGLASYRLTVFDNLPRTGLPPQLASWSAYERTVAALTDLRVIDDGTKIWWDLRPSARFPTVESRICDVPPTLDDTLTLAALIQCFARMLWRLARRNQRWRIYDGFLLGENRWRAQRYGMSEGLIDFGRHAILPFAELADEMVEVLAEDAAALGCTAQIEGLPALVARGNGADRQRDVFERRLGAGDGPDLAMRAVVRDLADAFTEGL
jgi:carboxylate-amine ligase